MPTEAGRRRRRTLVLTTLSAELRADVVSSLEPAAVNTGVDEVFSVLSCVRALLGDPTVPRDCALLGERCVDFDISLIATL